MQALLQIQQAARNVLEENMYVRRCRLCFCPGILKVGDQREEEGRLSLSSVVIRFSRFYGVEKVVEGPC